MAPLVLALILVVHALLVLAPAVAVWVVFSRLPPGKARWLGTALGLFGPLVTAYLSIVVAWLPSYSGECGGWLGETSPCGGFGQYLGETLVWAAMGIAMPGLIGVVLGIAVLLLRLLPAGRGRPWAPPRGGAPSFLVILPDAFSVLAGAPSDPRPMTPLAMRRHRDAVCLGRGGEVSTIVEVIPLRARTLVDRMLPWRPVPARFESRPGPDLALEDVRARLVSILRGDSAIADVLAVPADAAIARLDVASSPAELIDAAHAIIRS